MIQDTSLAAYMQILEHLSDCQKEIYAYMELHKKRDFTNKQLAYELKKPINTVTPRVLELRKMGLVVASKKVLQANGRWAWAWKVKAE